MTKRRKLTDALCLEIAERRRRGETRDGLAAAYGFSAGTITNAERQGKAALAERRAAGSEAKKAGGTGKRTDAAHAPQSDLTLDELRAELGTLFRGCTRAAAVAREAGEDKAALDAGRQAAALSVAIQRMTVPVPPDPNEQPDMMAAADRGRGKVCEYLQRQAEGKAPGRDQARPSNGALASSSLLAQALALLDDIWPLA